MRLLIEIGGAGLILLALIHAIFPRLFRWREDTKDCTLLTRQILHVHTFFIALTVFLMGALCVTSAAELLGTALGRRVLGGLALFWFCRLLVQFFGYSPALWKEKPFETAVHCLFILLWSLLSAVFFAGVVWHEST
jgi:Mn2+/Fe2+ NRAMP family transporter